jgi:HK97 family phage major capsid protein
MSDKLCLKIASNNDVEREAIETKRLKADVEYNLVEWRVLGVPFGGPIKGRDMDGEAFHEDTDIVLKIGDKRPVTYYHGFGPDDPQEMQTPPVIIGEATYTGKDARGHWFDLALDTEEELALRLMAAGSDGVKASSGAVSHLVRKSAGGLIDVWPVGELALFDTNEWRKPANEFAVLEAKEAKAETIAEAIPEAEESAVEAVEESVEAETKSISISTIPEEENIMGEPIVEKEEEESKVDVEALKKSIIDELKAEKGEAKGSFTVIPSLGEKDEMKGFMHYIRTGQENSTMRALKASNATDMNIGTAEDGQYLVPTGHYQNVIARRDEAALWSKLGVTQIPGIGTTVNVPYDNEADGEFVVTTETQEFDDDAPATGRKQMTLAKYSKIIRISHELLRDEDSRLESFLADWVGRGMAKTHNDLLITEVETNGTALKTFASATAVALGEMEDMVFQSDMVSYLDGGSAAWVMSGPSYAKIAAIKGDALTYAQTPQGKFRESILGFPVHFTNKADTIGSGKKSLFFGDWSQVGIRTGNGLQLIRDPYTRARYGQIELVYLFDVVYGVLNAEAIGYGTHATA